MEHYRGQKIYTTETNSERIGETIFYKHKYLAVPAETKAGTIEDAAKDLKKAIEGGIPPSNIDKEAIEKLMEIFKKNVDTHQNEDTERQRVQNQSALEQRMYTEKMKNERTPQAKSEKEKQAFNTYSRGIHRGGMQETLIQMLDVSETVTE